MPISFKKLPASDAPARRTRVYTGKYLPPRTRTSPERGSITVISYTVFFVVTSRVSRAWRLPSCNPFDHGSPLHVSRLQADGTCVVFTPVSLSAVQSE